MYVTFVIYYHRRKKYCAVCSKCLDSFYTTFESLTYANECTQLLIRHVFPEWKVNFHWVQISFPWVIRNYSLWLLFGFIVEYWIDWIESLLWTLPLFFFSSPMTTCLRDSLQTKWCPYSNRDVFANVLTHS